MKKPASFLLLLTVLFVHSSFTHKKGGDVFRIFWNGKQIHQQFVHINKDIKTLHLSPQSGNDHLELRYSHCGKNGTNRSLIFRNEKNETIKTFQFPDNMNLVSGMVVLQKAFGKMPAGKMNLFYRSEEMPAGMLLAVINWSGGQLQAGK